LREKEIEIIAILAHDNGRGIAVADKAQAICSLGMYLALRIQGAREGHIAPRDRQAAAHQDFATVKLDGEGS